MRSTDVWSAPGEPGPVTRKAQDLFSDLVAAKIPEYRHWLSFI